MVSRSIARVNALSTPAAIRDRRLPTGGCRLLTAD